VTSTEAKNPTIVDGRVRVARPRAQRKPCRRLIPERKPPRTGCHALQFEMPKSRNPLHAYEPDTVPEPALSNSGRLDRLVKDGTLYITMKDAIDLALEDNLDLAIARYNLPIANTDILRTKAGGFFRGVNTGVVQGTPGGGVGGFGTGPREQVPVAPPAAQEVRGRSFGPGAIHPRCWNRSVVVRSPSQRERRGRASDDSPCQPADLWRAAAAIKYRTGHSPIFRNPFRPGRISPSNLRTRVRRRTVPFSIFLPP
jgi:hypothetical protein